jgi:hypothetical protein
MLIWLYAKHKGRLIDHRLTGTFTRKLTRQYIFSNILFMVSFIISLVNPVAGMSVCVGITILYLFPPKKPEYTA